MSKPTHRRCGICNVVTARYIRTERHGAITLRVFERNDQAGEVKVLTRNGTVVRCAKHAEAS